MNNCGGFMTDITEAYRKVFIDLIGKWGYNGEYVDWSCIWLPCSQR